MKRDCKVEGHVTVGDDLECVSCEQLMTTKDVIGLHYERAGGELASPLDRAKVSEWGPVSLGDYVDTVVNPPAAA